MQKHLSALVLSTSLAAGLAAAPVSAQDGGAFRLELNNTTTVDNGCRLTYVATNALGLDLSEASYEVAVFDGDGLVQRLLILQFGELTDGRTKVVQFDLADTQCDGISRLLVNSVSECTATDGSSPDCLAALETSSRSDIAFGL